MQHASLCRYVGETFVCELSLSLSVSLSLSLSLCCDRGLSLSLSQSLFGGTLSGEDIDCGISCLFAYSFRY